MDAVEYLKAKSRMTNNCRMICSVCPFNSEYTNAHGCNSYEGQFPKEAVEIVEKWAKENPVKTYLSVLLEKLPNAKLSEKGMPYVCIAAFFGSNIKDDKCENLESCKDCWNREYKEDN